MIREFFSNSKELLRAINLRIILFNIRYIIFKIAEYLGNQSVHFSLIPVKQFTSKTGKLRLTREPLYL